MTLDHQSSDAIVSTAWLEAHLSDPDLRIFDCTTYLRPAEPGEDVPYHPESGRASYEQGHIPGAGFLDLPGELSDPTTEIRFMMPAEPQFAAAMSRHGVGDGTRVVLYSAGSIMWATRVWWMLRTAGFDAAAVLDGGWEKWCAENRPVDTSRSAYPPATFVARPRNRPHGRQGGRARRDRRPQPAPDQHPEPGIVPRRRRPLRSPWAHSGQRQRPMARPDRSSRPVPSFPSIRPSRCFAPWAPHRVSRSSAIAAAASRRPWGCCCYIGSAHDDLRLYDASMGEWARDETLPIERG